MIVFTLPTFFADEDKAITRMFQCGLLRLHLRKPEGSKEELRNLIAAIPSCYHNRIVIHEHFSLLKEFSLAGVHLNRRNPEVPEGWEGHISTSCHSIEELKEKKQTVVILANGKHKDYDYLSLSPIFDSVSKQGYNAAFSEEELLKAKTEGIIDERVMALGGITAEKAAQALSYGFGDVMVLGDAWKCSELPVVLTIAGSDTSAGAGIQQDLKTITNCGGYGATVITAITSQNTVGVQGVMPVPGDVVKSQLRSVFSDLDVRAVKIGMIPNIDVARVIIDILKEESKKRVLPIVCDPIMISTSGTRLMSEDCIALVKAELFPLCTLVTPNMPENEVLGSLEQNVLVKGGHAKGNVMTDVLKLRDEGREVTFTSEKIQSKNLHGTGCTLSSAITTFLAQKHDLCSAVALSKEYMNRAIAGGKDLKIGKGNGPLWINYTQRM